MLRRHANVLYHLFPNTLVLVEPDDAAIVYVWPESTARTTLETSMLLPEPPATEKARAYWDANDAILHGCDREGPRDSTVERLAAARDRVARSDGKLC